MSKKDIARSIRGSCYALLSDAEEAIEAGHLELYEGLSKQIGATIGQLQNLEKKLMAIIESETNTTDRGHSISGE